MPNRDRTLALPLVVVEDDRTYRTVLAEAAGAGWRIEPPGVAAGAPLMLDVVVREAEDARRAVLAAVHGAVLLVRATATRAVVDDLIEDLGLVGRVVLPGSSPVRLDVDTWRLLHALAAGATLATAARGLHVSMSTANRRLTEARDAFAVPSRAQLLRSLGASDRIPPPAS